MKNRFLTLIGEAVAANMVAFFAFWNIYAEQTIHSGDKSSGNIIWIIVLIHLVVMVLVGIHGWFYLVVPYSNRIKDMKRANEESQKAEQIRREFVANVSHELKTPLTSISGFIETLQAGAAEDPEIRTKFIDIIAIETARLKRLIQDLLVLSDIENKKGSEASMFNVRRVVENTVESLKPIAENKNIKIIQMIEPSIKITGSADRFSQMMVNLIENAIKYSNEGGRVWINAVSEEGKTIISVKDEGIGIAPEHHDRLFERFYRVDKSRSKKAGGTGLGLSIVKHIAVLLGATLEVESDVGKGTEFFVIFDMKEDNIAS